MTRSFTDDLTAGKAAELDPRIAAALSRLHLGASLAKAPWTMEKTGVDLVLHDPETDRLYRVEVKARQSQWNSRDVVLEVLSANAPLTFGWGLTTRADYVVVLYQDAVLVFHGPTLVATTRQHHTRWTELAERGLLGFRLIETKTRNKGNVYSSIALVVPITELQGPLLLVHRSQPQAA
jgi:hypothetical protein|uniref:DUF4365 domain-containing protein n=1 Tax=Meiothermus ruber TaxID=277 RepID=A0A7C3HIC9_MEIRU